MSKKYNYDTFDFDTCSSEQCLLGDILLDDETMSKQEFSKFADEVIRRAKIKGNMNADDGEALAKDSSGRNSHNAAGIEFITIDIDDDDFDL